LDFSLLCLAAIWRLFAFRENGAPLQKHDAKKTAFSTSTEDIKGLS